MHSYKISLVFILAVVGISKAIKYEISVQTGTNWGAGTDANVYITLYGYSDSSGVLLLSAEKDDFEDGDVDVFVADIPDIGPVSRIKVQHDDSGWSASWYLKKVEIKRGNSESVVFDCNSWISKTSGLVKTFFAKNACGLTLRASSRIVGGHNAQPGQWPWQVSVSYKGGHWCGGSIVDNQWIISAAHCFHEDRNEANYKITVGEHDLRHKSKYEQVIQIEKIVIHAGYDDKSEDNDIALLKLKSPIRYNSFALPVCLASSDLPAGTNCWISGWGALKEDGHGPAILQQAKIPLVSKRVCGYVYGGLTTSMRCAGFYTGKIDACQGDSGGPLVCNMNGRWHLMGAVSWGIGCAREGYYGVYADIVHLKSWIKSVM